MRFSIFALAAVSMVSALPIPGITLPDPLHDSFYNAPSNLGQLAKGQIYDTRQIVPDLELAITFSEVQQIAYKTSTTNGTDTHTVGTLFIPLLPSAENRLFSYQFWEDADNLDCSPSYSLAKGVLTPDGVTATTDGAVAIAFALSQGWHVIVADHEGPNSEFLAGHQQAYAGLDGIRAAENWLGWDADTPVSLYGYSGGGSATVWMTNEHESYAPELNIVGAAHGGTPVDVYATLDWLDNATDAFSGFIVGAFDGLLTAYPQLNETAWPTFDPLLKNRLIQLKEAPNCVLTEVLSDGWVRYQDHMSVDVYTDPTFQAVFKAESLLNNVSSQAVSVPKFPRYIFHADNDEIIPAQAVRQYVEQQCQQGANIQYVPWLGNDHVSIEYLGIPDAFQFIKQSFEGNTPSVMCGTPNDDILTLGSKFVGSVIGQAIADVIIGFSNFVGYGVHFSFDPNSPYQQGKLPPTK